MRIRLPGYLVANINFPDTPKRPLGALFFVPYAIFCSKSHSTSKQSSSGWFVFLGYGPHGEGE